MRTETCSATRLPPPRISQLAAVPVGDLKTQTPVTMSKNIDTTIDHNLLSETPRPLNETPDNVEHQLTTDLIASLPQKALRIGATTIYSLSRETRMLIWYEVLAPGLVGTHDSCHEHEVVRQRKTTSILRTCSTFYVEAIEVLQTVEHHLVMKHSPGPVFRNMRDIGFQYILDCRKRGFRQVKRPGFTELSMLRFRNIAVQIEVCSVQVAEAAAKADGGEAWCAEARIDEFCRAAQKSPNLAKIRLLISRVPLDDMTAHDGCMRTFQWVRPLLELTAAKGIKIRAEELGTVRPYLAEGDELPQPIPADPLVMLINSCIDIDNLANFVNPHELIYDVPFVETDIFEHERHYTIPFHFVFGSTQVRWGTFDRGEHEEMARDFHMKRPTGTVQTYQLHPECRTCYGLFTDWHDLKSHLDSKPSHRRPYKHKAVTTISCHAAPDAFVQCHECGYPADGQEKLWKHMYKWGHKSRKVTPMPRWKEDQMRYDAKEFKYWQKQEQDEKKRSKEKERYDNEIKERNELSFRENQERIERQRMLREGWELVEEQRLAAELSNPKEPEPPESQD